MWDRILGAVSGLVMLGIGAALFIFGSGFFLFRLDLSFLDQTFVLWQRVVMMAVAILFGLIGVRGVLLLFRSNRERRFILQHTEYGDLSISINAMESMVRKCVDTHDELKVSDIRILHARDGIIASIRIALASGVNIPIAVSALQKQIKQYITSCSGVDVKEVRVMVETNSNLHATMTPIAENTLHADVEAAAKAGVVMGSLHETAQNMMPSDAQPSQETEKRPLHQRLFRREEKPHNIPQPPISNDSVEINAEDDNQKRTEPEHITADTQPEPDDPSKEDV